MPSCFFLSSCPMRLRVPRSLRWWLVALLTSLGISLLLAPDRFLAPDLSVTSAVSVLPAAATTALPELKPHPLPPTLAQWRDPQPTGDYFDQVKPLRVGYLVWSHFPVTVYVEPVSPAEQNYPPRLRQAETWITAVRLAIQEWNPYLPLKLVDQAKTADIAIWRSPPPLKLEPDDTAEPSATSSNPSSRPTLRLSRVRSAETQFDLYLKPTADPGQSALLAHRFTIRLRPDQAPLYLQAAARHELGHALGIWGHSQLETDVMYFSQVRHPGPISPRDINTLKRIYEQPTRLGWNLDRSSQPAQTSQSSNFRGADIGLRNGPPKK